MDPTVIIVVIIAVVVVVALLLFRTVIFEATWKGRGGLKLGASNQESTVQRDVAVKEVEAKRGRLDVTTPQGSMTGDRWSAATDVRLVAGGLTDAPADPKARTRAS